MCPHRSHISRTARTPKSGATTAHPTSESSLCVTMTASITNYGTIRLGIRRAHPSHRCVSGARRHGRRLNNRRPNG